MCASIPEAVQSLGLDHDNIVLDHKAGITCRETLLTWLYLNTGLQETAGGCGYYTYVYLECKGKVHEIQSKYSLENDGEGVLETMNSLIMSESLHISADLSGFNILLYTDQQTSYLRLSAFLLCLRYMNTFIEYKGIHCVDDLVKCMIVNYSVTADFLRVAPFLLMVSGISYRRWLFTSNGPVTYINKYFTKDDWFSFFNRIDQESVDKYTTCRYYADSVMKSALIKIKNRVKKSGIPIGMEVL
jgi:hypothetical protein